MEWGNLTSFMPMDVVNFQRAMRDSGRVVSALTYACNEGIITEEKDFCDECLDYYRSRGFLSPKQLDELRGILPGYHNHMPRVLKALPFRRSGRNSRDKRVNSKSVVNLEGNRLSIDFDFSKELVDKVKGITGRRFDRKRQLWTIPLNIVSVEAVRSFGFVISQEVADWYSHYTALPMKIDHIPGVATDLFQYQHEGVEFIEHRNGRALVADQMGLGKSLQALAWCEYRQISPTIIIVPASLKLNWKKEIKNHIVTDLSIEVLSGRFKESPGWLEYNDIPDVVIINYDILATWADVLLDHVKPEAVILDEIHYIKDEKTKRTKAVKLLCEDIPHIIGLTGTPILNRPIEIFNALNIIDPLTFPDWWTFAKRYCKLKKTKWGHDAKGASNIKELHYLLTHTCMIRRLKKDVLADLPDKIRSVVPMYLDNEHEYRQAERNLLQWITTTTEHRKWVKDRNKRQTECYDKIIEVRDALRYDNPLKAEKIVLNRKMKALRTVYDEIGKEEGPYQKAKKNETLVQIEKLKQLSTKGKMDACVQWIHDFLDTGEKLVVFSTHTETNRILMKEFGKVAVLIDGSVTKVSDRQKAVDRFQEDDKVRLFVGNIKAAGVGHTLTASSSVCFLELPWTPGELLQAEDRVHRIGQEADSVNIYYLVVPESVEEEILELLQKKITIIEAILDGTPSEEGDSGMLDDLLASLGEEDMYEH